MARITPKLNWISSDVPAPSDFNRIENNNKQAFDEIDANEAQRDIDETALQANIDGAIFTALYGADITFSSVTNGATRIMPRGFVIVERDTQFVDLSNYANHVIQTFINGSWVTITSDIANFYSDGTSHRIYVIALGSVPVSTISHYRVLGS